MQSGLGVRNSRILPNLPRLDLAFQSTSGPHIYNHCSYSFIYWVVWSLRTDRGSAGGSGSPDRTRASQLTPSVWDTDCLEFSQLLCKYSCSTRSGACFVRLWLHVEVWCAAVAGNASLSCILRSSRQMVSSSTKSGALNVLLTRGHKLM